jgi:UDP-N-acetyl-D-glucosamine dehydrogenase
MLWNGPHDLRSLALDAAALQQFDCAVVVTDHRAFDYELIVAHSDCIVDTRNALGDRFAPNVVRLGAPAPPNAQLLAEAHRKRAA